MFNTPVSQLLLEWDAMMYNEACELHGKAMAEIGAVIESLPGGAEANARRRELLHRRNEMLREFQDRSKLFWHGVGPKEPEA